MLQFCIIFLRKIVSVILLFHLGLCSSVKFKGVWRLLYISNQLIFNKRSGTKLSNISGFCFFLRIFRGNLRVREHVVGLRHPVKELALVLNVRCDLICFSFLTWIAVLECWFTSEIPPIPNTERRWTKGTIGRVYTIFVSTNPCILVTPTCTELRFSFTHFYQLYSERYGITG